MTGWEALDEELSHWRAEGRTATFWWRDDDAARDTPELRRLLELAAELEIPLALAVIPARADRTLAAALNGISGIDILQHGYSHANHAGDGDRKSELGSARPAAVVSCELDRGRRRLDELFGDRWLRVLVPPWNRIAENVAASLPGLGYGGLSGFGARATRNQVPELVRINTHVDIIDWRGSRGFRGEAGALGDSCAHLRARRTGAADPEEPTGLLTHHLVQDDSCWRFARDFVRNSSSHPAARWLSAADMFR